VGSIEKEGTVDNVGVIDGLLVLVGWTALFHNEEVRKGTITNIENSTHAKVIRKAFSVVKPLFWVNVEGHILHEEIENRDGEGDLRSSSPFSQFVTAVESPTSNAGFDVTVTETLISWTDRLSTEGTDNALACNSSILLLLLPRRRNLRFLRAHSIPYIYLYCTQYLSAFIYI
jgi:hypothetical protein